MKKLILSFIIIFAALGARAHTGGKTKFTCPIDKTEFEAWQDYSGTSFGARLDFKRIGPIAQPWAIAQCPKCKLPLYKEEFADAELEALKKIVESKRFKEETAGRSAHFATAVIMEEQNEKPSAIAHIYLQASWEVEKEASLLYKEIAGRVIKWCDKAAAGMRDDKASADEYHIMLYLPVEMLRRTGEFAEATRRLEALAQIKETEIEWMKDVVAYQRTLISKKDSAARNFGEWEKKE